MALNALGNGLATPFLLIYLHSVRGFSLETVGLIPLTQYGVAIAAGLAAGPLIDRVGGRATAAAAMLALAAGFAGYPFVHRAWQAFVFAAVVGIGTGAFWPGYNTLLARLTPRGRRHGAYAIQGVVRNLGFGVGGVAGGLIADVGSAHTFTLLFLLNAVTYVAFAVALVVLVRAPERAESQRPEARGRYRDVLGDRAFLGAIAVGMIFAAAGIAQFNSILPVFARSAAGVHESAIGLVFLVNTLTIVLAQLPITRIVEGRRRMRGLTLLGVLWAACWCTTLLAWLGSGDAATLLLLVVGFAFGLGECVLAVIQGPLVADLAPEHLRGRYTALALITAQLGYGLGPAVGGFLLAVSAGVLWSAAGALCLAAGLAALALERRLPDSVRRTPGAAEPAVA
jgi:MFS family permease